MMNLIFFTPSNSKLAVEFDWNTKISQIPAKSGFLEILLEEKPDFFFKIGKGGKIVVECVPNDIHFLKNYLPP